jgi:CHRD domain
MAEWLTMNIKYTLGISVTLAAILVATVVITSTSNSIFAQQQKFTANLTGSEEVPPNTSTATGNAEFNLNADGNTMSYQVNVMNIDKVTMAHIHSGKTGENGPVVVWLFNSTTPSGPMNGMLSQGNITSNDLVGPLKGKQMSDLSNLITDGQAYVNVHTEPNPKGEIRGQISS